MATTEDAELPQGGNSGGIATEFYVGTEVLDIKRLIALSIKDAWLLCGENEDAFQKLVADVAVSSSHYWDIASFGTPESWRAVRSTVDSYSRLEDEQLFASVVNRAVRMTVEHDPMPDAKVAAWNEARRSSDHRTICHAATTNLYFGRDGYVGACCYSRSNPLGHFPSRTIAEIWAGEKIARMRRQLSRCVLPSGCEICAEQLTANNFEGFLASNFESLPDSGQTRPVESLGYPVQMEFELSNKCNLECAMCSGFFSSSIRANRENKPPLPMNYDSRFVEQLKPFIPHLKSAKFLGGEPFLIDIYYEIWDLFIETNPNCDITITTNASVFTAKAQRIVEKLNCQVVISFDSISKPVYEGIRVNATFERTLENLEKITAINRAKNKPLGLAVCPMVSNWHEIPEIVEFANARGMTLFFNTVIFPVELSLKHLPRERQSEIATFFRKAVREPRDAREAANFRALTDVAHQIEGWMTTARGGSQADLVVLS
jgi:molybdenum cofactor biosynthesis enzyme MoaA